MNVLITGAARGIGKAIAQHFLKNGWSVVALDREKILYDDSNLRSFQIDITHKEQLHSVKRKLEGEKVSINLLINNAGYFKFLPITDSSSEELEHIFRVNTLAPFTLINLFRDDLVKNQGRIINMSSENVKLSGPFQPYPSSKIALESLSEAASQELSLLGVDLVVVQPGAVATDLLRWDEPKSAVYSEFLTRFYKEAKSRMSSVIQPEHVARLVFRIAMSKSTRRVYKINHNPWLAVFSRMPRAIRERIIVRMLK